MLFSGIELDSNGYVVTGVSSYKGSPYYTRTVFGKISNAGLIDTLNYPFDSLPYEYDLFGNSLKKISAEYLATGSMKDSVPRAFIVRFDTLMNVMFWREYTDSPSTIFQGMDVIKTKDGGYLLTANQGYNGDNNVVVIRTDSSGTVLNKKVYHLMGREFPWIIRPMLNGNYMIGAFCMKINTNTPFWAKTWMLEVDSMGNLINQWADTNNRNLFPRGMQQTADSGWILVRQHLTYDVNNYQKYNAGVVKYDKSFGKEWEIMLGDSGPYTGFYDVEILSDGKYILTGTTPTWGHDSAYHWGWIVKLDTNGTVLWDRKYNAIKRYGALSFPYDIDVMSNGDILVCGELQFLSNIGISPIQQGWILRTDSNGCEIGNCLVGIGEPQSADSRLTVYPNPASEIVIVEVSSEFIGGEVILYDVTGKIVKSTLIASPKLMLNVNDLQSSLYVVSSEKNGKAIRVKLFIE